MSRYAEPRSSFIWSSAALNGEKRNTAQFLCAFKEIIYCWLKRSRLLERTK